MAHPQEAYDQRLARLLVRPLARTPVSPNHLTTACLITGLAAALAYAVGQPGWAAAGALLFIVGQVLDHADGELARLTGKTSRVGHRYDLTVDFVTTVLLFVGVGIGLRNAGWGLWGPAAGLFAGASVAGIYLVHGGERSCRADRPGEQIRWAGFEIEDALYIVVPFTWLGLLKPFMIAAVIGAPAFAAWALLGRLTRDRGPAADTWPAAAEAPSK